MKKGWAIRARACALAFALISSPALPALAQDRSVGDQTGSGAEGTIGRGFNHMPWGPSDIPPHGGPFAHSGSILWSPATTYYMPGYTSMARAAVPSRPYLTNHFYEPGDGYRYQLYYNPATRGYFYYPVRR